MKSSSYSYEQLRELVANETLPVMLVDLDAFDRNAERFIQTARSSSKTLRPASKSVRVPALLNRLRELGGDTIRGLMCYSAAEAAFLAERDHDDLLVAHPHVQLQDVRQTLDLTRRGRSVTLMLDSSEQAERLARLCQEVAEAPPLRICIDVDASLKKLGQHFGVQRSSVRGIDGLTNLIRSIKQLPQLQLVGAMTYEAQVAGLADTSPHQRLLNPVIRRITYSSMNWLAEYRQQIRQAFADENVAMKIFNGGGSGCLEHSAAHAALTEVTAGSGFLQSHLFDHYALNKCEPALFFALPITRIPQADRATCQSGGFIASGAPGPDRPPTVFLPTALSVDGREGFGEVQTPLVVPQALQGQLRIGDPVFFRPAKAGEIAERFNEYCLLRDGEIANRVPTYRGLGQCFF